jgi:plastocyanin
MLFASRFLAIAGLLALLVAAIPACLRDYGGVTPPSGADLADPRDDPQHPAAPPIGEPTLPPPPPDLAATVVIDAFMTTGTATIALDSPTGTFRLNEKKDFTVTITPNGATGTASLALTGAPTGLSAVFDPPSVTLAAAPVTSKMTVTATSSMDPATSVAAAVTAMIGGMPSSTTFGVTVLPELVVYIQPGVALTNNTSAFGATSIPVKLIGAGTKITFINNDGLEHRIHSDGTGGLAHQPNNMGANGGTYEEMLTATGTINFNCHIHGGMKGQLVVQ